MLSTLQNVYSPSHFFLLAPVSGTSMLLRTPVVVTRENREVTLATLPVIGTNTRTSVCLPGEWEEWAFLKPLNESAGKNSEMLNLKYVSID